MDLINIIFEYSQLRILTVNLPYHVTYFSKLARQICKIEATLEKAGSIIVQLTPPTTTQILSGGAKQRYVYANDPSKVYTLNVSDSRSGWRDDKIPEMLGNRMWHGCTLANVDNEVSKILFITCQPPILNLRIRIFF